MSSIVYQVDKKTGTKYAFESTSFWDKEKKQPRSKRKYLGKVDPETGEIIPSRGRSSKVKGPDNDETNEIQKLQAELRKCEDVISGLRYDLDAITVKYRQAMDTIQKIQSIVKEY